MTIPGLCADYMGLGTIFMGYLEALCSGMHNFKSMVKGFGLRVWNLRLGAFAG